MSLNILPGYVDAAGAPSTITLTYVANVTVTGPSGYTITGTATFTWNRVMLTDILTTSDQIQMGQKFLYVPVMQAPETTGDFLLSNGEFLCLRDNVGPQKDWRFLIAGVETATGVLTKHYTGTTPPPDETGNAYGSISGVSNPFIAPGWALIEPYNFAQQETDPTGAVYGFNQLRGHYGCSLEQGATITDATVTVSLVRAADSGLGLKPIYRLTFPIDSSFFQSGSLVVNGLTYTSPPAFSLNPIANGLGYNFAYGALANGEHGFGGTHPPVARIIPRSALVFDLEMSNYTDVISSALVTYNLSITPAASCIASCSTSFGGAAGISSTLPISDIYSIGTLDNGDAHNHITVQFG